MAKHAGSTARMEVSALKYPGGMVHGRASLLRLQSDERLVSLIRRGNNAAFETLVSRYEARLLAFCRHLLGSREDAEDVLQEALAAAFNAILADERPINVRPWLYRIARNRSLNHLRRVHAVGVDSMDIHLSDHGASTADKVHDREEFRLLVGDINSLPETQRTALVLREMDALSYEQIAEAMETTVSGVKSLLVRARVSLAEAAEARLLSCEEVRIELGEVAEGLRSRPSPLVRRHLKACRRCESFRGQLRETNKALTAVLPIGPLALLRKFALSHLGHSAGAGSGATAAGSGATALGSAAIGGASISSTSGFISAGIGAIASKGAAGLAVTALVTAGAMEADHGARRHLHSPVASPHGAFQESAQPASQSPEGNFTARPVALEARDGYAQGIGRTLEAKAPSTDAAAKKAAGKTAAKADTRKTTTSKATTGKTAAAKTAAAKTAAAKTAAAKTAAAKTATAKTATAKTAASRAAAGQVAAINASADETSATTNTTKSTLASSTKPAAKPLSSALRQEPGTLAGRTEARTSAPVLDPASMTSTTSSTTSTTSTTSTETAAPGGAAPATSRATAIARTPTQTADVVQPSSVSATPTPTPTPTQHPAANSGRSDSGDAYAGDRTNAAASQTTKRATAPGTGDPTRSRTPFGRLARRRQHRVRA